MICSSLLCVRSRMSRICTPFGLVVGLVASLVVSLVGPAASAVMITAPPENTRPIGCGKARQAARMIEAEQLRECRLQEYRDQLSAGLREALEDTDVLHCDLEIEITPGSADNLAGTNLMTIQSKSDSLTQFTFRLRSQYNVTGILINGSTPVGYSTLSTTTKVVTLDRTYTTDEIFTLEISYYGHAESRGFGSIEFAAHSAADIVYTLSEAYYAYTWWPCKDGDTFVAGDNGDKFTLDLAVISPDTMVTASNGLLQGVDPLSGNRHRYRWASNYPISTYLVCFSSTNYNTWSETYLPLAGGTMPVDFYIYPEHDAPFYRDAWSEVVQMLYTFRDMFGEYPFVNEKYGIYDCNFGGGMEHQTFTAQGTFVESVTAHEAAHQWWGDMVTCKTWNHIWLNEAFASYSEALWAEFKPGSTGHAALKSTMNGMKYTGGGSVYVTDAELGSLGSIFDGNTTYHKGAWVVHMLRHLLGDQNFFDMLAAYRAAFEFSAATTQDFQAVCEQFYGASLDWFFQQWIFGEYAPEYTWGWEPAQVNGKDYVLLSIDQTQDGSIQRFTMPIDISPDAAIYTILNDADPQHFVIPVPAAPASVGLDALVWILRTRVRIDYAPGPPKIVETAPAPGADLVYDVGNDTLSVWFQTNVNAAAGDFSLAGTATGARTFALAAGTDVNPVVLNLDAPLPGDTYTLTVSDAVTAVDSGQALDGETADPADPASLPSGNGVPGGAAVVQFIVRAPGDFDGSGSVDLNDFATFSLCFSGAGVTTPPPACPPADFDATDLDGDGDVDLGDFNTFSLNFTG